MGNYLAFPVCFLGLLIHTVNVPHTLVSAAATLVAEGLGPFPVQSSVKNQNQSSGQRGICHLPIHKLK